MPRQILPVFTALLILAATSQRGITEPGTYTRIGAEAGGNAGGEIPAFEGATGLECPAGYQKGDYLPSPYRDEKVLFRIDHTNVDRYAHRLSPGQVARLRKHQNFHMNVYPTHRNFEHPEVYYRATEKNVETCRLDEKNLLQGWNGGIPFPFPRNGLEAIWNVKRPWAGDDFVTDDCRRIVGRTGQVRKTRWTAKIMGFHGRLGTQVPNPDSVLAKGLIYNTYPADREGEAALEISFIDDSREPDIWVYMPTLRRVRRAAILGGGTQLDGESTLDETGFDFRDSVEDWGWKLLGKKEMYVPANNYEVWAIDARDEDECWPMDLNPLRLRYELHRVWVVEGTLKQGVGHPYSRRVGYYDEDHWQPVAADRYDRRGNLWRMAEYFQNYNYCNRYRYVIGYLYMNLESDRYEVSGGCRDKDTRTNASDVGLEDKEFSIQTLRVLGR